MFRYFELNQFLQAVCRYEFPSDDQDENYEQDRKERMKKRNIDEQYLFDQPNPTSKGNAAKTEPIPIATTTTTSVSSTRRTTTVRINTTSSPITSTFNPQRSTLPPHNVTLLHPYSPPPPPPISRHEDDDIHMANEPHSPMKQQHQQLSAYREEMRTKLV